jgi:hypothetical protein
MQAYHRYRPWVGVGWILKIGETNDPQITIITRLLDSPAGRAKIKCGSILLSRNGEELNFASKADYQAWRKSLPKIKVGEVLTCRISEPVSNGRFEERTVVLKAEMLRGDIPTYAPPMDWRAQREWAYDMARSGVCTDVNFCNHVCPRTGVSYQTFHFVQSIQ